MPRNSRDARRMLIILDTAVLSLGECEGIAVFASLSKWVLWRGLGRWGRWWARGMGFAWCCLSSQGPPRGDRVWSILRQCAI